MALEDGPGVNNMKQSKEELVEAINVLWERIEGYGWSYGDVASVIREKLSGTVGDAVIDMVVDAVKRDLENAFCELFPGCKADRY